LIVRQVAHFAVAQVAAAASNARVRPAIAAIGAVGTRRAQTRGDIALPIIRPHARIIGVLHGSASTIIAIRTKLAKAGNMVGATIVALAIVVKAASVRAAASATAIAAVRAIGTGLARTVVIAFAIMIPNA